MDATKRAQFDEWVARGANDVVPQFVEALRSPLPSDGNDIMTPKRLQLREFIAYLLFEQNKSVWESFMDALSCWCALFVVDIAQGQSSRPLTFPPPICLSNIFVEIHLILLAIIIIIFIYF